MRAATKDFERSISHVDSFCQSSTGRDLSKATCLGSPSWGIWLQQSTWLNPPMKGILSPNDIKVAVTSREGHYPHFGPRNMPKDYHYSLGPITSCIRFSPEKPQWSPPNKLHFFSKHVSPFSCFSLWHSFVYLCTSPISILVFAH